MNLDTLSLDQLHDLQELITDPAPLGADRAALRESGAGFHVVASRRPETVSLGASPPARPVAQSSGAALRPMAYGGDEGLRPGERAVHLNFRSAGAR